MLTGSQHTVLPDNERVNGCPSAITSSIVDCQLCFESVLGAGSQLSAATFSVNRCSDVMAPASDINASCAPFAFASVWTFHSQKSPSSFNREDLPLSITLKPLRSQLPPLIVGACYISPLTSSQLIRSSAVDRFDTLTRHLRAATAAVAAVAANAAPGHVILAGSYNATASKFSDAWVHTIDPSIPVHWQSGDQTVNSYGHQLMQLCEDTCMVLCTGRTLTDTPAAPSFPRANSRLHHALVSPQLFPLIQFCGIQPHRIDSDHSPLVMQLHLSIFSTPNSDPHHIP